MDLIIERRIFKVDPSVGEQLPLGQRVRPAGNTVATYIPFSMEKGGDSASGRSTCVQLAATMKLKLDFVFLINKTTTPIS